MRRTDREVTDFNAVVDILRRADTIRLGMHAGEHPYVVPLSFGFEVVDGRVILYFHGAKAGRKHDLLRANPHVCVEADIFHRYVMNPGGPTTMYESFIGFGLAEPVTGGEAAHGMDLMLTHCGFDGYAFDPGALEHTEITKITLDTCTGKRHVEENW